MASKPRRLEQEASDDACVVFTTTIPASREPLTMQYRTRSGALLRIDGVTVGAFDREHGTVDLPPGGERSATLTVERRSLPVAGLPAGPGLRWWWMQRRAQAVPARYVRLSVTRQSGPHAAQEKADLALIGHAHLDIAWLWTYAETRRKAVRTFAIARSLLAAEPTFVFSQSQPQLYAFVREEDPALFAEVAELAQAGRFDASGAALWVEADCNIPSGESLIRQLVYGSRFAQEHLGTTPSVAWLPDSFGFANTLPTLLAHAGVRAFATTKLQWNDTTRWPYPQFRWCGPDGSSVLAAVIDSYDGGPTKARVAAARLRGEPLVLGYGDGGGGVTPAMIAAAPRGAAFTRLGTWFDEHVAHVPALPTVTDELYLEYHRGIFTTYHAVKAQNARLERSLGAVELLCAWAAALRATPYFLDEVRRSLRTLWEIVLRAQFHDVLPGTAIATVYDDVFAEGEAVEARLAQIAESARSILPRAPALAQAVAVAPVAEDGTYRFDNGVIAATVCRDGSITMLRSPGGRQMTCDANVLCAYIDRPTRYDAWNLDRSYVKHPRPVIFDGCEVVEGVLEIRFRVGASPAVMHITLRAGEPLLRVELAVAWAERHTILRCQNRFDIARARAVFGTPHGVITRPVRPHTAADRAKFEFCGQRFAQLDGAQGVIALLTVDTYGWSLHGSENHVALGHSLLRSPSWPDPQADAGEQLINYAFAPRDEAAVGTLEACSEFYVGAPAVPMFVPDRSAILVVATKIADDGDGIIVRLRECDGWTGVVHIACAARAAQVVCVDALERPVSGSAELINGSIVTSFEPYTLRSFRIRP